jgi:hypothetical protein
MTATMQDMGKDRKMQLALVLVHLEKLEAGMKADSVSADMIQQVTDRKLEVNAYRGRDVITDEMMESAAEWDRWYTASKYCK